MQSTSHPVPDAVRVHTYLRETVSSAHRSLERSLAVGSPHAGEREHVAFLAAWYGWLATTSEPLWRQGPWSERVQPEERARKRGWLADDLRALGVDPDALPKPSPGVGTWDRWQRLGYAYVEEGSLLGSAVLRSRWAAAGSRAAGARYLLAYGDEASRMWRDFLAEVAAAVRDRPDGLARAGATATAVFRSLHAWFRQQGVAR